MSIPFAPISPVTALSPTSDFADAAQQISSQHISASTPTLATPGVEPPAGGDTFTHALDAATQVERNANQAAVDLATGKLTNPHEFTALAAQARLQVELTAAIRNRAVDAFGEVMRMQV